MSTEGVRQGPPASADPTFWKELCNLLNKHNVDTKLQTPDWVIANYVERSIDAAFRLLDSSRDNKVRPELLIEKGAPRSADNN